MKRFRLAATWVAMIGLAACQGRTPTAPSGAVGGPASVVLNDGSDSLTARLTASPSTISAGQSATLTWTTTDADAVYLDGVQVARSGSMTVSPTATKTYTVVAVNDIRVSSSATITVTGSGGSSGGSDEHVDAHLVASPTTIQPGQSSTLTWTTDDADHAYLNGVEVSRYGSKTVSPASTTTYTLVAVNGTLRDSSSVTVTVSGTAPPPPPVATPTALLTPPSATIQSGQSVTLTWATTNATSVTMNGNAVAASGSQSYSPTVTTTYTLVASNSAGSVTDTTIVTVSAVTPPPSMPTATLTPPSATITSGQSVTLTWSTTNATSVTMNGVAVGANGSQSYSPTVTTTYTLVASNSAGSVTDTTTVTVNAPMPTALINAMPMSIQSGQSATLQWSSSNATTIMLNGSAVNASGSRTVMPTATTTYTLVASNATGSVQSAVTVTVTAPPPPPPAAITYVNDIKPIMDSNCIMCHGGPQPTAGRDFSTYAGVMTVVTPGDPNSRIIQMTRTGGSMHFYLNPNPDVRAQTIYDWIVTYGAPQQ